MSIESYTIYFLRESMLIETKTKYDETDQVVLRAFKQSFRKIDFINIVYIDIFSSRLCATYIFANYV